MNALWLCLELQKKGWEGDDRNGINRAEAAAFLFFEDCVYSGIWDFNGGIVFLWCFVKSLWLSLKMTKYQMFLSLFLPVIFTALLASCVPSVIYRSMSWLSPLSYYEESGFGYHRDKKRGSEGTSSNCLYFWNAKSGIVMCFLCQGRQKMSEQVCVCCWAACQLSPFAVTRRPMWHYSGSLWVVSSSHSFGGAW